MPSEPVSTDTTVRIQCLEMANRQHWHGSADQIVAAAQKLYEFATNAANKPPEKMPHGF